MGLKAMNDLQTLNASTKTTATKRRKYWFLVLKHFFGTFIACDVFLYPAQTRRK